MQVQPAVRGTAVPPTMPAQVHGMFERLFSSQYDKIRATRRELPPLPESVFIAMVAAVNELLLRDLEQYAAPDIAGLEPHVQGVVESLLRL